MSTLSASAQRVQNLLRELGFGGTVQQLSSSTRTAPEAAASVGCELGQIVKSLIFQIDNEDTAILALVSGINRLSEPKLSALLGKTIIRPDADFVRRHTGFAIGGVAPIGHQTPLPCYVDRDLTQYDALWAAAGTPKALFQTTPEALLQMTQGQLADIKA